MSLVLVVKAGYSVGRGSWGLSYLGLNTQYDRGDVPIPTFSPKRVGTFPLRPHGVAVTVMVTFTGASVDSCAGSEPGVVGGGSVPTKNRHKQRRERCPGGAPDCSQRTRETEHHA